MGRRSSDGLRTDPTLPIRCTSFSSTITDRVNLRPPRIWTRNISGKVISKPSCCPTRASLLRAGRTPPTLRHRLRSEFASHLSSTYFSDAVSNLSPRTLYYYLLQQYRQFHLQGWPIHVNPLAFGASGISCRIPFMDSRLIEYMYSMPENWGRGLELRTTKYPLRYLANERWHMPIHILEEDGPHSYISESDLRWNYSGGKWSINCEIMFKSVLKGFFQSVFSRTPIRSYFDPACFDLKYLQATLNDYCNGVENPEVADLLYKLGLLFSTGVIK